MEKDPTLAIGTAKELIETCCKTIQRNAVTGVFATARAFYATPKVICVI